MSFGWIRKNTSLLGLSLAIAGGFVSTAFAQSGQTLDLDLKDADLVVAVQALTKRSGLQFVIADDPSKFRSITLSLRNATAEDAIQSMVTSAGAYVERSEAGVYIIRVAKPTGETTTPQAVKVPSAPKEIRKIRITKADPVYIYQMLTNTLVWDPTSGMKEVTMYGRDSAGGSNSSWTGARPPEMTPMQSSLKNYKEEPLMPGRANDIAIPGESANQLQGGGGGGFPGGGGAGAGGAGNQGGTQLQAGQGLVPDGIDYLSYDPTDNSLIVQGTDEAIRRLQQAIALFDRAPKQCEIKVEFITTSQSLTRSFGVDWTFSRGAISMGADPGRFASTSDPIFVNYSTGNLVTALRTQLLEGRGKVVSAPLVRSFNNQISSVFNTLETTYFTATTTNGPSGVVTTYNPTQLTIQTNLVVRPRINDDGYITMTLNPTVSDLGQVRVGPDGQEVPDRITQGVSLSTRVKDGETIVLGGLNRKSNQTRSNKFPILGDLPILGQFFRSNSTSRDDSELLIFVTARILPDDSDTGFNP